MQLRKLGIDLEQEDNEQTGLTRESLRLSGWMMGTLTESILQQNPSPSKKMQMGKEYMVVLAKAASLECYPGYT